MALFGGQRDMDLFNKVNKELITDIVDTEVYYYMLVVTDTKANLYGEGKDKVFHNPIKVPALVERNQAAQISDEFGQSYSREVQFRFLRQQLVDRELVPEVGDIIQWNNEYHLIDASYSYQYFAGKNPKYWDGGDTQGYNLSIICETHVTRKTQLKLEDNFRFGNDVTNNDLPTGV